MKKAFFDPSTKGKNLEFINQRLKKAFQDYYCLKSSHRELRYTALEQRAEAMANEGNLQKKKVLKELRQREQQRVTAKKIRYLQGKQYSGSTMVVSIQDANGNWTDITDKASIEQAIMACNEEKYEQSFHVPFLQAPLVSEFGYKGLSSASEAVLAGVYGSNLQHEQFILDYLNELEMPEAIREAGEQPMAISVEGYRGFWRKAKENISCYPSALSFATMKAGASNEIISQVECTLTNTPLQSGYSPSRWKRSIDVMILKKSGVTHLSSLRTIVLFEVDCNFAFKHIGREMMKLAECKKVLAPEQYGSMQHH
jgi:hypothetical protein